MKIYVNTSMRNRVEMFIRSKGRYLLRFPIPGQDEFIQTPTKRIALQHGGGFGIFQHMPAETLMRQQSDEFWSWGWQGPNVRPMPALKLCGRRPYEYRGQKRILYVANGNWEQCVQAEYLEWQDRWFSVLPKDLLKHVKRRLYREDAVYEESFEQAAQNSRLVIVDNNSTTLLECLALNVPVIAFWNPGDWRIRESAATYFQLLRAAGILLHSPESAAFHVIDKYDGIRDWWNEPARQQVRRQFIEQYARTSKDWAREWIEALDSL